MATLQIKNRTSTVPPERTAARIEELLAKSGATDIRKRYEGGELRGLDFVIPTDMGVLSFRMPVDVESAFQVMYEERRKHRSFLTGAQRVALKEQAKRTAWRLAQDWLEVQLSLVAMRQAELVQVLLPYAVKNDQTFFQAFKASGFAALLPPPKADQDPDQGDVIDAN
jgi:hypothetical protein